jgi:transposase
VAVTACARKLAAIAWSMLIAGEPYRYAIPRSTEDKLRRLRVKVTGQRRRTGPAKGQKSQKLLPGGGRTIRSLHEVCRSEQLPAPHRPADGERVARRADRRAARDTAT